MEPAGNSSAAAVRVSGLGGLFLRSVALRCAAHVARCTEGSDVLLCPASRCLSRETCMHSAGIYARHENLLHFLEIPGKTIQYGKQAFDGYRTVKKSQRRSYRNKRPTQHAPAIKVAAFRYLAHPLLDTSPPARLGYTKRPYVQYGPPMLKDLPREKRATG